MKSKHRILHAVIVVAGLWAVAGACLAADAQAQKPAAAKAVAVKAAPADKKAAAGNKASAPRPAPALVDINSASKEELKKLPHVGDAEAERIIAGRPYLSKAHLQTHNVVSPAVYQDLRGLVVARQKDAKFVKAGK